MPTAGASAAQSSASASAKSKGVLLNSSMAAGTAKKRKVVDLPDVDVLAKRAIRDNFADFTANEIYGNRNGDGDNLFQVICKRKQLHHECPAKFPCGRIFYDASRKVFQSDQTPEAQLKTKNDGEKIDPRLFAAMVKYTNSKKKEALGPYIRVADNVNQKELVGLLAWALDLKPLASIEQFNLCMDVLFFVCRVRADTLFPDEMEIMKEWFDNVLCAAYKKTKGAQGKPSEFLTRYKTVCRLVLNIADVDVVLAATDSWDGIGHQLARLGATRLGMMLFGKALIQVQGEIVKKTVVDAIDAMMIADGKIQSEAVVALKKKMADVFDDMDLSLLPEHRLIEFEYRGCSVKMKVRTVIEEVELRTWASIKAYAAACGDLVPFHCEEDLIDGAASTDYTGKFAADILDDMNAARKSANEAINAHATKDAESIVGLLKRREAFFVAVDRWFVIEVAFLASMQGIGGTRKLEDKVLALMPSGSRGVDLATAVQEISQLQSSPLYKFCSTTAQGAVASVSDMLQLLTCGKRPSFPKNGDAFCNTVRLRLQFFAVVTRADGPTIRGIAAILEQLSQLVALDPKDLKLAPLENLIKFDWLLTAEQCKSVHDLATVASKNEEATSTVTDAISLVAKNAKDGGKSSKKGSTASGSKLALAPKKPPGKKLNSEVEAALAMFSRK
jgi:hypothetical protein